VHIKGLFERLGRELVIIGNEFLYLGHAAAAVLHGGIELNPVARGKDKAFLDALIALEYLKGFRDRGLREGKFLSHVDRGRLMAETDYDNAHSLLTCTRRAKTKSATKTQNRMNAKCKVQKAKVKLKEYKITA
jgi:hypothetical protein